MPAKKLTLRLDEDTIGLGKEISSTIGKSLSAMMYEKIHEEASRQQRLETPTEYICTNRWGMPVPKSLREGLSEFTDPPTPLRRKEHMEAMMEKYYNLG